MGYSFVIFIERTCGAVGCAPTPTLNTTPDVNPNPNPDPYRTNRHPMPSSSPRSQAIDDIINEQPTLTYENEQPPKLLQTILVLSSCVGNVDDIYITSGTDF